MSGESPLFFFFLFGIVSLLDGSAGYRCTNWRVLVSFTTANPNYAFLLSVSLPSDSLSSVSLSGAFTSTIPLRFSIERFIRYERRGFNYSFTEYAFTSANLIIQNQFHAVWLYLTYILIVSKNQCYTVDEF